MAVLPDSTPVPASRRGFLSGLAALPALTVPVIAGPNPDVEFLALAPRLVPLLNEYDRLWAAVGPFYEAWDRVAEPIRQRFGFDCRELEEALPEWGAYLQARTPADELDKVIEEMTGPFINEPMVTLPGLVLRHRLGKTFEHLNEDVLVDLDRLVEAQAWA